MKVFDPRGGSGNIILSCLGFSKKVGAFSVEELGDSYLPYSQLERDLG